MTTKTALTTVLTWGIVFACVGSAIGAMIGAVAPEYYRSVFRGGHRDSAQVPLLGHLMTIEAWLRSLDGKGEFAQAA